MPMQPFPAAVESDAIRERDRVQALHDLDILDTPPEEEFDELVQLASEICDVPISLVSLVDAERQWFKASVGLGLKETDRNVSFCSHAIRTPGLFEVENATQDARFSGNSLVTGEPFIRFYAGIPLEVANGLPVGTLCVIDTVPRTLTESQKSALAILSRQVKARMELRAKQKSLERAMAENDALNAELRYRNSLFTAFTNNGPFVCYIKDATGRMLFYNHGLAQRFGVTTEEWIGRGNREIWPPEIAAELERNDAAVLQGGVPVEVTEATQGPGGATIHWRSYKFPFSNDKGELMLAGMSIDVSEEVRRKAALETALEEKLKLARSLESTTRIFQAFVDKNPNVCFFKSEDGRYLAYNARFAAMFGIGDRTWIGKRDVDVLPEDLAQGLRLGDTGNVLPDGGREITLSFLDAAGAIVWHRVFQFPISMPDGSRILACVAIDVTQEMEKEQALSEANTRLEQLATTDALTGLANRRCFEQRLATDYAVAMRNHRPFSLLMMDIDNFKQRNDTFGHAAGDDALRALAQALLRAVRLGDLAARIGGEEFAILLAETGVEGAEAFAARIQAVLRAVDCGPGPALTVSIGISTLTARTPAWSDLVAQADEAMYQAKRAGKDRYLVSAAVLPTTIVAAEDLVG